MTTPPIPSPKPAYVPPSKTPTGEWKIQLDRKIKVGSIVVGCTLIATIGGGILAIQGISRAEAQTASAPLVADLSAEKVKLEFLKAELARHLAEEAERARRVESKIDRQDQNQQLVLDALNVPKWKRPPPVDGGAE